MPCSLSWNIGDCALELVLEHWCLGTVLEHLCLEPWELSWNIGTLCLVACLGALVPLPWSFIGTLVLCAVELGAYLMCDIAA